MTKFVVYNVQLLPTSDEVGNVGNAGYKRLLSSLRDLNRQHRIDKTLQTFHFALSHDVFFGPSEFYVASGYVYGYFRKYNQTNVVSNLNSGKVVFRNTTKNTTISKYTDIEFLFDTRAHYLAIDGGAGINLERLTEALMDLFTKAKADLFPSHDLHVNLIASPQSVEEILSSAVAYKKIALDLTFQNGGERTQTFLREMRMSRTQRLRVEASGGTGKITRLPEFMDEMVRAAALVGSLHLTYYAGDSARKLTYDSKDAPLAFVVRHSVNDEDQKRYFSRVREQLSEHTLKVEQDADAVSEERDNESPDATDGEAPEDDL